MVTAPDQRITNQGRRTRGLALPVVLITITAMAGIALKLVAETRLDLEEARNLRAEIRIEAAADAAVHRTLARLAAASPPSLSDTRSERWRYDGAVIDISVSPESARIDLNVGAPALITGALKAAGAEQAQAEALSKAIVARRDLANGIFFRRVDELLALEGVTPNLFAVVAPMLTVYSAQPGFDVATAPPDVLLAAPGMTPTLADQIIIARETNTPPPPVAVSLLRPWRGTAREIFRIRADATGEGGARFIREAVVDLSDPSAPVVYAWSRVSAAL